MKASKIKEEIKSDSSPQPSEKSDEDDDEEDNKVNIFHILKMANSSSYFIFCLT